MVEIRSLRVSGITKNEAGLRHSTGRSKRKRGKRKKRKTRDCVFSGRVPHICSKCL